MGNLTRTYVKFTIINLFFYQYLGRIKNEVIAPKENRLKIYA